MESILTEISNDRLRDYVSSLPEISWLPVKTDRAVHALFAAMDHFKIHDSEFFDFRDSSAEPKADTIREAISILASIANSEVVNGYYERHCAEVDMNPFAELVWSYLRARQQLAEQNRAPDHSHGPSF